MSKRSMCSWFMLVNILLAIMAPSSLIAEQVYSDVYGSVTMTDATYYRKVSGTFVSESACWSAPGTTPGMTCMNSSWEMYEDLAGSMSMVAVIDGIEVSNDLLPTGSYYRIGFNVRKKPYACTADCHGFPCGVECHIGNQAGLVNGSVFNWIDIPAVSDSGAGFAFSFPFCDHDFIIGCACWVVGSAAYKATLRTPVPVNVHTFPGGAASHTFPSGIDLGFQSGPEGTVTATSTATFPPVDFSYEGVIIAPRYWEVKTDMPPGSYLVDLQIAYSPSDTSAIGGHPTAVLRYNETGMVWEALPAAVDQVNSTATVANLDQLSIFVIGTEMVPVKENTRGGIKSHFD